jgi:hypothetical protein
MKPILSIPIAIIILLLLFSWLTILLIPLASLKFITGEDYSRAWMFEWVEKPLKKCGLKIIKR